MEQNHTFPSVQVKSSLTRLGLLLLLLMLLYPGTGWGRVRLVDAGLNSPDSNRRLPGAVRAAPVSGSIAAVNDNCSSRRSTSIAVPLLADLTENFEVGSKTAFAIANVSLASGEWTLAEALIDNVSSTNLGIDKRTSRIRERGSLAMNFDKPNGAATITLKAAAFPGDAGNNHFASFIVEVFNIGPITGSDTAVYRSSPVTVTGSLQTYSFLPNVNGDIRVRISNLSTGTNFRINLDDVVISSVGNAPPSTYTWSGGGGTSSWSNPANWQPLRTTPAGSDVLIFDGTVTGPVVATLDFPASAQTIGQLHLRELVSLTLLNTDFSRTLNLDGELPDADFTIGPGSVLTLRGASGAAIVLNVTAGETALISGRVASEKAGMAGVGVPNRLTGQNPGAIRFERNSLFETKAGVTGSPFGSRVANKGSVVFGAGATFRQEGGGNAFGLSQPDAVTIFEPGSLYQLAVPGSTQSSIFGRTFGSLEFASANSSLADLIGSFPLVIQNDLRVGPNVKVALNLTGGIRIGGNIIVEAGGDLVFNPTAANTITLDGTQQQYINGPGPILFDAQTTLGLDNTAGVLLQAPIRVNGTLDLQSGVLTSSAINLLTLAATATVTGGSATNYVSGPVARQLSVGTTDPQFFPVGDAGNYRPVTIVPSIITAVSTIMVEQHEGQPAPLAFNDGLKRVSRLRRYSISASPALSAAQFAGTVTLSFDPNDQVTNPAAASLVIARTDGTGWKSLGRSTSTGPAGTPTAPFVAGTLTSAPFAGLEIFGTYTLASTDPDENNNPLPVQLLSFGAERQAVGVQVRWATATEQNSASFEVQRSATGQEFRTIATVAAQGNSSSAHSYAALDWQPLPGLNYYRLRQLDLDGKEAYSSVVSVSANGQLRVYPNPATSALTVEAPSAGARYRILSLLGSEVRVGEMPSGTAVLDVAALPAGLYQLEVNTSAGRSTSKFIKQ